ncbi:MAG: 50S ribosomal protein L13, partial [Chloroflexi bacterium]|nr:50S ribosomal protein L13 [Chloroflexota bacterium]
MKTYSPKASDLRPQWHVLDAAGQTLGRLAVRVAHLLKGKHKPIYSPHMLVGDFVVIINSRRIKVTGNKIKQKIYYRHSLYPGGLKEIPLAVMLAKHPNRVIEHAVKGMLPHNRLGRQMMRRLKTYPDSTHPHEAQVTASLKVAEKEEAEGVVWIGLPKPVIRRRPKRKRATVSKAVADETSQVEETATEEEPTSEVAAAATVEAAQPETPTADETSQVEKTAADEPSVAEQEAPVDDSPP